MSKLTIYPDMVTVDLGTIDDMRSDSIIRNSLFDTEGKLIPLYMFSNEPFSIENETWAKYAIYLYRLNRRGDDWVPEIAVVISGYPKTEVSEAAKLLGSNHAVFAHVGGIP